MLEVEVKYPVDDLQPIWTKLTEWKAKFDDIRHDVDQYFNAPDRDFGQTDEALRIRSIGVKNVITYKGPKRDAETKTRTELELALADGPKAAADWATLLTHLKYRPSGIIKKTRRIAHLNRAGFEMEVCLDGVENLGRFVELEIVATEKQYEAAKEAVLKTAGELGLTNAERRSYLEMMLAKLAAAVVS